MKAKTAGKRGRLLRVAAVAYPLTLVLIMLCLRFVGERWWVTTAALYLPHLGFALPLPLLTLAIIVSRRWLLLPTQIVALLLIVFPLLGFQLPGRTKAPEAGAGAVHLRVLTFNTAGGRFGFDAVINQIRSAEPDVIALQEVLESQYDAYKAALPGYAVRANGQFLLASHLPIAEMTVPDVMVHDGAKHSRHYVRFQITTPAGPLRIYDLHTISPRESLDDLRGAGLKNELESGHLFHSSGAVAVERVASLRGAQVAWAAEDAIQSPGPALIAGDTNLPQLSWARAQYLSRFQDAFTVAGSGFGYTFPVNHVPWMRIDRILATPDVRILFAAIVPGRGSDHLPVIADIELH